MLHPFIIDHSYLQNNVIRENEAKNRVSLIAEYFYYANMC
jgi:hypothetical protein